MIADFTDDKCENVFYEAGLAFGLGIPVISCCRKNKLEENKLPFDRRNLPHNDWENWKENDKWVEFTETLRHAIIAEPGLGAGPLKMVNNETETQ